MAASHNKSKKGARRTPSKMAPRHNASTIQKRLEVLLSYKYTPRGGRSMAKTISNTGSTDDLLPVVAFEDDAVFVEAVTYSEKLRAV